MITGSSDCQPQARPQCETLTIKSRVRRKEINKLKICIVSDSHDHCEPLAAVTEAEYLGAQAVLHCSDLEAPSTLHAIVGPELIPERSPA